MTEKQKKWLIRSALIILMIVSGLFAWKAFFSGDSKEGLAGGNGRIEAVEIDIAAKIAGRVREILVREGDFVTAGQVVAKMDTENLEAQLRQAEAQEQQAKSSVATAYSQLAQRQSEKAAALAVVRQREAELMKARQRWSRTSELVKIRAISKQEADDDYAQFQNAEAAVNSARAQVSAGEAGIMAAKTQIEGAKSAVKAARANVERIQADIKDSVLVSPRDGRIQYRVAQLGEVVSAGGRVLNMIDLGDVYMTFFLPAVEAGQVAMGAEVRIKLDAAPDYVIPARVSFVSDVAQFTPKTVETAVEREKLMFRIKAQLPEELLKKHIAKVKTGLPGVAYVRLDANRPWPEGLQVRLPQ
jgi:HlyD family secretion protein